MTGHPPEHSRVDAYQLRRVYLEGAVENEAGRRRSVTCWAPCMAGGMNKPRTPYGTAVTIAATQAMQPPGCRRPPRSGRPLERLRHCWVVADEHGQVPALLLEWREIPDGWEGRVVRRVCVSSTRAARLVRA